MPQKKAKKAPSKKPMPVKAKKPAKAAKTSVLGAALKSAAKTVTKNLGLTPSKKALPPKKGVPVKPEKPGKKAELAKKPLPAAPVPAAKGKKGAEAPALALVKGKKEELKKGAKAAPEAPKGKGAKGKEVVLEVPAPKGVALLAKEGKGKKGKAAEAAAAKLKRCREPGCEHEFTLVGYCRMHYIKNWRRIKRKEAILASGQLNNYVEELVNKYPDKYLDVIRQDLATEKEWGKVVVDLELEATDEEGAGDEDLDAVAEGVRPSGGGGAPRGEFDDEGDAF
jgi:hypothetical protein